MSQGTFLARASNETGVGKMAKKRIFSTNTSLYRGNDRRQVYSFNKRVIGSRILAFDFQQFLSYLTLNNIVTLKSGLEVAQGHSNWYHSKAWSWFPIRLP